MDVLRITKGTASRSGRLRAAALVLALAVGLGACGRDPATGDDTAATGGASSLVGPAGSSGNRPGDTADSTDPTAVTAPGDAAPDNTAPDNTDSGGTSAPSGELPGSPFDIGPAAGQAMAVVGVRYDDVLNFRARPDPAATLVATAAPLASTPVVRSAGDGRLLDRSAWWRVTVDGAEAWANLAYLGSLGTTSNALADFEARLASSEADDLDAMIDAVVAIEGAEEPPSMVTVVAPPTATTATFDLTGLGDDALKGFRFAITVASTGHGTVELTAATRTPICSRGVSGGLCQ